MAASLLKKTALGCGAVMALFVLTGIVITLAVVLDRPEEGDRQGVELADTLYVPREKVDGFPEEPAMGKPVDLDLNLRWSQVTIKPGTQRGKVLVEGSYDHANFELKTDIKEKDDRIVYRIDFESKSNMLATMFGMHKEIEINDNELTILLPVDMPLNMDVNSMFSEVNMDLTGVAVTGIKGKSSMGSFTTEVREPNPVAMDHLEFEVGQGEGTWKGLENLGFATAHFEGGRAGLNLNSTGPFRRDATISVDFSIGGVDIMLPPETNIDNKMRISMGEEKNHRPSARDDAYKTLTLEGKLVLGELNVLQVGSPQWVSRQVFNKVYSMTAEEAVPLIREAEAQHPEAVNPGQVNSLGYFYLRRDRFDDAIAVFELNVALHPDYANGYDSLGEGFYEKGDLEQARQNYQRALDLNPDMDSARHMLRKINGRLKSPTADASGTEGEP